MSSKTKRELVIHMTFNWFLLHLDCQTRCVLFVTYDSSHDVKGANIVTTTELRAETMPQFLLYYF